ncbi:hypothetical protein DVG80_03790 [Rhodococcus erythropolis]|nr:hypothetical protein DVG80_03790 [Rhodococcus erythropolis]
MEAFAVDGAVVVVADAVCVVVVAGLVAVVLVVVVVLAASVADAAVVAARSEMYTHSPGISGIERTTRTAAPIGADSVNR